MAAGESKTLELLLEAGKLLSSTLDIGELLKTVLQLSARVVKAESASLLLLDEKTQELYFDVALGLGEKASAVRLKLGQGIAGAVAQTRRPAIINDARSDPRWSPQMDAASGFVTRSILAVPLTLKGRSIGVVEAINRVGGDFSPEDLRAFEAFASQAAVAIENARLFSSLKEEKFKLDTIFKEMTDGAILADAAGRILLANGAARGYMGTGNEPRTLEEAFSGLALSPSLHEILGGPQPSHDLAAARESPKKLMLAGKITRLVLGGSGGAASTRAGERTGWLCVFRDETEEWQKEKLKRTFLSLISHKLKTPLAAVTGFADVLLEDFRSSPAPPAQLKAVEAISSQGRKLANLVDKLLRYTTLDNPEDAVEFIPCALDEIVSEALISMKDSLADCRASVAYEPAPGLIVIGDKGQLLEVVKNLVENAAKFDPKPEKGIKIRAEEAGGQAALRVQDTGRGIPPEDQDKVFSRFHQIETYFTGQVDGWGLGLAFVKKVVEAHRGRVELKSKLGEGTTVSVFLPRKLSS